jgi:hypothetical protein
LGIENSLLLSLLAANASDEAIAAAMPSCVFGLTGEFGGSGFGATTLEGHMVLFTHPEFYEVAGLPEGLDTVEATAQQAADYALAVRLLGFVINPGTHQRFIPIGMWRDEVPVPELPPVPTLAPLANIPDGLAAAVVAAAEDSEVEAVWIAAGPSVVTRPHPDPAFEAGLLARDVRIPSYGASLWWPALFSREAAAKAKATFRSLTKPLSPELQAELVTEAQRQGLTELWAFEAEFEGQPPVMALAYSPHPHDAFAAEFDRIHARNALGETTVPLLSAETLREVLPRIGECLI